MISAQDIKELREKTGAGIADVKKALEESGGDKARAVQWLERKLGSAAVKKASRETKAGLVETYLHSNGRIGSMVELYCETDFVARNPEFKELAHDIAMHVAAMSPLFVSFDSVPKESWDAEKVRFEEEVKAMDKPESIKNGIVEGKLQSHFGRHESSDPAIYQRSE
jgi:elongation factor Ts